jgi:hypothetical protein
MVSTLSRLSMMTSASAFVQLNKVKIGDVSGEVTVVLTDTKKIDTIDADNLSAALDNCESWFGKKLSENVISGAYTPSVKDGQVITDRVDATKVFNMQQEPMDFETVQPGKTCDVILEFAGLWFARRHLDRPGILSRSGSMMTPSPSSILTQTNMLSLMKMTNKKIVIHI